LRDPRVIQKLVGHAEEVAETGRFAVIHGVLLVFGDDTGREAGSVPSAAAGRRITALGPLITALATDPRRHACAGITTRGAALAQLTHVEL